MWVKDRADITETADCRPVLLVVLHWCCPATGSKDEIWPVDAQKPGMAGQQWVKCGRRKCLTWSIVHENTGFKIHVSDLDQNHSTDLKTNWTNYSDLYGYHLWWFVFKVWKTNLLWFLLSISKAGGWWWLRPNMHIIACVYIYIYIHTSRFSHNAVCGPAYNCTLVWTLNFQGLAKCPIRLWC